VVANHPPVAATPSTQDRSIAMHANLMVHVEYTVTSGLQNGVSQLRYWSPGLQPCRSSSAAHGTHISFFKSK
jgi:hypothetical protein